MTDINCRKYEECNCPICPKDPSSMKHVIWYPDEDVCPINSAPSWVKRQRKIARKTGQDPERGYFTHEMLSRHFVITNAIKGLDPDNEDEKHKDRWFRDHQVLRERSEEEKERSRTAFMKCRSIGQVKNLTPLPSCE